MRQVRAHGIRARYLAGCRCPSCIDANTAYHRRHRAHSTGWQPAPFAVARLYYDRAVADTNRPLNGPQHRSVRSPD